MTSQPLERICLLCVCVFVCCVCICLLCVCVCVCVCCVLGGIFLTRFVCFSRVLFDWVGAVVCACGCCCRGVGSGAVLVWKAKALCGASIDG